MPATAVRSIIEIDEEKCDGCGLCVPACEEGAIQIIDGKARLVQDRYCDGLGACLGDCPRGAITIVEREAEGFDEEAVLEHVRRQAEDQQVAPRGCPSSQTMSLGLAEEQSAYPEPSSRQPQLRNWPVQLTLVPVGAPWLDGADLLICADCVPFAYADFHDRLIAGRQVITACPKLDDIEPYFAKLTEIFREHDISSVTVARMEVPCCGGLPMLVEQAMRASGRNLPVNTIVVGIEGDILGQG
jgi:Fe-S-cluster-containing hydrogenase component 2